MRAALLIGAAFLLAGCSQERPVRQFGSAFLDCSQGFDALAAEIKRTPAIIAEEYDRGTSAYRDDRASALYLITRPDHPAHPAIFVRHVALSSEGASIVSGGCGFGDLKALDTELKAYSAFDRMLNAEYVCHLCSSDRLLSPSAIDRYPPPPIQPQPSE
ncbi:hypothetical protein [Brevundimonas faecalis]|uniref:Lipoprotein n=1 Tax=Brevundimonas faecalis TaxID=947378 RepID=A0ABV2REC4_9CAUL